ncbi:hypothetical protein GGU10DRAFT_431554 [Lentinula aff. detonsa]|uniref:C2H2-type domain-containing protein n=1 Tax=Lentinula aff. detonsa TaxID=2804958 RepID=A0AA38NR63_9AGAR|nr:hypothetical protein GGU10DRAFT_431554 [Lentinula aff. detonsa]
MSAPFTSSQYGYSRFESLDHIPIHTGPSNYGYQQPSIYNPKGSEFDYHLPFDDVQLAALLQDAAPTMPEQYQNFADRSAFESPHIYHSDEVDDVARAPAVFSWPVEYFVAPSGSDFISESFGSPSPSDSSTPDLMYSVSSLMDDTPNVFDMHFGAAIGSNPCHPSRYSYSDSGSLSPMSDSSTRSSRQSPIRTPSPLSDSSSRLDHRRRFPCLLPGCSRRFTSQYTLKVHMEAHKPKPKVSFPCTLGCTERFSRQHDRLRHEVAKHGKVCEFSCEDCGRFFSSGKTLGNHRCPVAQGSTRWVNN